MLLVRRRWWWLGPSALIVANCADQGPINPVTPTPTSIVVTPESFLGDAACGTETGGLLAYQATLIDVTDGLDEAPTLPSSAVVDCTSTVIFETVEVGHRYGALITAFDRGDLRARSTGSQTVVDADGNEVAPHWTTLCTGHDGEIDQALGGAGGEGAGEGGSGNRSLGVLAVEHAAVPVGGCAPLSGDFDPNSTGLRIDPQLFLGNLTCGAAPGQVETYSVEGAGDVGAGRGGAGGVGGAGGAGGLGEGADRQPCAEAFVLRGLPPGQWFSLEILAFEADGSEPTWTSTCTARTQLGALVTASCDRLSPL